MQKFEKHLLLYSNVNAIDYVDINLKEEAKAWTILFHFRGKSQESILYEEFNSTSLRNLRAKTHHQENFNKLYSELINDSFQEDFRLFVEQTCGQTGWPIDMTLEK